MDLTALDATAQERWLGADDAREHGHADPCGGGVVVEGFAALAVQIDLSLADQVPGFIGEVGLQPEHPHHRVVLEVVALSDGRQGDVHGP